ncbi:MAG: hypothetical protein JO093_00200 [Acidobacteria bacterium]|nr:hypothetical protein [Acidobacteriota bacterium]MBV9067116.1 hypothetical protein [Acidobacteriota bacterium]MBV9184004.1 hypothetical protein [Acidobacteriota bacterium]
MTKLLVPFLILLPAAPLLGAVTHVRIRCDNGHVIIAGSARDTVAARTMRARAAGIEVTANDGETISVPRTAGIEWLSSGRATATVHDVASVRIDAAGGEIRVERIAGNIDGKTANANVIARDVGGSVVLATGNGNIELRGVRGLVEVTTGNGNTTIANAASGVRVTSINGATNISCVAGGVSVQDTSGRTAVSSVAGDVDLFTALGAIRYDGVLQPNRAYRIRTLDGAITLAYAAGSSGFSAQLASDAALITIDRTPAAKQRRVLVRAGDERARVVLDAVGGRVELLTRSPMPACR